MTKPKYFMLSQTDEDHAELSIFGDITSWRWDESDVSAYSLSKELKDITTSHIAVHINSRGGDVGEGLAIYNALKNHNAEITTYCDGFVCSIASVIFMAGDKRVMCPASMLMIHNPWMFAQGNATQLRKAADDLDTICSAVIKAYKSHVTLDEEALKAKLDEETWITPDEAIEWGFATEKIEQETEAAETIAASMGEKLCAILMAKDDGGEDDSTLTVKIFKEELDAATEKVINAIEEHKEKPPDGEPKEPKSNNRTPNKLMAFFLSLDGRKEDE